MRLDSATFDEDASSDLFFTWTTAGRLQCKADGVMLSISITDLSQPQIARARYLSGFNGNCYRFSEEQPGLDLHNFYVVDSRATVCLTAAQAKTVFKTLDVDEVADKVFKLLTKLLRSKT